MKPYSSECHFTYFFLCLFSICSIL